MKGATLSNSCIRFIYKIVTAIRPGKKTCFNKEFLFVLLENGKILFIKNIYLKRHT